MRSIHRSAKKDVHILLGKIRGEFVCALVVNGDVQYRTPPNLHLSKRGVQLAAFEVAARMDMQDLSSNWKISNGMFPEGLLEDHRLCKMISTPLLGYFSTQMMESLPNQSVVALIERDKKRNKPHGGSPNELWDTIARPAVSTSQGKDAL